MRRRFVAFCAAIALATPALAETPLTAEEFDAHTQGRTLYYFSQGRAYGAERYMPGRTVTWSFLDGECKDGYWYPQGRLICFVYEDSGDPQCWSFFRSGNGMRALFEDEIGETELYEAGETDEEMLCLGPKIGV